MDMPRDNKEWLKSQPDHGDVGKDFFNTFNEVGEYQHQEHARQPTPVEISVNWVYENLEQQLPDEVDLTYEAYGRSIRSKPRDYSTWTPYCLHASPDVVKHTFENTTQFARSGVIHGHIRDTHRSPFPALNIRHRNEPVATCTMLAMRLLLLFNCELYFSVFYSDLHLERVSSKTSFCHRILIVLIVAFLGKSSFSHLCLQISLLRPLHLAMLLFSVDPRLARS